jgi:hypothetical protein
VSASPQPRDQKRAKSRQKAGENDPLAGLRRRSAGASKPKSMEFSTRQPALVRQRPRALPEHAKRIRRMAGVAAQRSPQRSGEKLDFVRIEKRRPRAKRWGLRLLPSTPATRRDESTTRTIALVNSGSKYHHHARSRPRIRCSGSNRSSPILLVGRTDQQAKPTSIPLGVSTGRLKQLWRRRRSRLQVPRQLGRSDHSKPTRDAGIWLSHPRAHHPSARRDARRLRDDGASPVGLRYCGVALCVCHARGVHAEKLCAIGKLDANDLHGTLGITQERVALQGARRIWLPAVL